MKVISNYTVPKVRNTIVFDGLSGEFDTACLLHYSTIDSYDALINLPCQNILFPLYANPNDVRDVEARDENQFMITNWRGKSFGSIDYLINLTLDRSYDIFYTDGMDHLEDPLKVIGGIQRQTF